MAGTKTIKIVYDVNTQSVQAAKQSVTDAKLATDQLTASAQKLGQQGQASTQQFSQTIYGLNLQMQQLKAVIDLTNQSDTARLQSLNAQYKAMQDQMAQYKKNLEDTNAQTANVTQSLSSMYNMVKLALTAGLIKETLSAVVGMAALAGKVEGVRRAFDKLPESTKLMADLREKTHGTIDELTLMQTAVKAQNFKIPLDQLGKLLEFAAIKAQQTGLDIDYLVNSLITGLGRNSTRILDNLQFSIVELNKRTKELGSTQAAVFSLIDEQMVKMGGYIETSETKTKALAALWTNFKITLSTLADNAGVGKLITGMTHLLELVNIGAGGKSSDPLKDLKTGLDFLNKTDIQTDKERYFQFLQGVKDLASQAGVELIKLTDGVKVMYAIKPQPVKFITGGGANEDPVGILKSLNTQLEETNKSIEDSTDVTHKEQDALQAKAVDLQRLILIYSGLSDQIDETDKVSKGFGDTIRKQLEDSNKVLSDQLHKMVPKVGTLPSNQDAGIPGVSDPNSASANFKTWYNNYATFWDKLADGFAHLGTRIRKSGQITVQDYQQLFRRAAESIIRTVPQVTDTLLQGAADRQQSEYDERIKSTDDYYSKQIELAGNNQAKVKQLEAQQKKEDDKLQQQKIDAAKRANIRRIEIDTAMNIVKSIVENGGIPWGLPEGATAAALGLAQIAATKGFAKGVIDLQGPGTSTSDSIPARLSKGESVMTAEETFASKNVLQLIRTKKLNDRILEQMSAKNGGSQQVIDLSPVVKAIKSQPKAPDAVKIGSLVYKVQKEGDSSRKYIHLKYHGY